MKKPEPPDPRASLLVLTVPMGSLMIHLTKIAWDKVCPTYPSLQKSAS